MCQELRYLHTASLLLDAFVESMAESAGSRAVSRWLAAHGGEVNAGDADAEI